MQRQPLCEQGAARLKQLYHHQTLALGYGCDRQMRVLRVQDVLAVRGALYQALHYLDGKRADLRLELSCAEPPVLG